ncbi:WD repeat-containing protein 46-like, partial [Cyanistes caeruleus]|uniref:WD repeat-containing protein 46-like n=1 Tax=Cyanistes caeruleus TaxID=156563 RepID=UPI000CDA66A1
GHGQGLAASWCQVGIRDWEFGNFGNFLECFWGFTNILVPGAGEPNLDALESNPFRSRRQRQEWEVKALLEKVYSLLDSGSPPRPFLQHRTPNSLQGLRFCPFQDVLGAGHGQGFTSILVPGAGEPNLDALEANPFRSRRQRQEWEVKALLEKIPWQLLTPEPSLLSRVDEAGLEQKRRERIQRLVT